MVSKRLGAGWLEACTVSDRLVQQSVFKSGVEHRPNLDDSLGKPDEIVTLCESSPDLLEILALPT